VPLTLGQLNGNGEYLFANISVGPGGTTTPVIVDTGSRGLYIPETPGVNVANLGPITGSGSIYYGSYDVYDYHLYTTTVNFGNGIITEPVTVGVIYAVTPHTGTTTYTWNGTAYVSPAGQSYSQTVPGVMGMGPNAVVNNNDINPNRFVVTQELPSPLGQGVLIDATGNPYMEFGANPLQSHASVSGAPSPIGGATITVGTRNDVSPFYYYDNGQTTGYPVIFDTGGLGGSIPINVLPADHGYVLGNAVLPYPNTNVIVSDAAGDVLWNEYFYPQLAASIGPTIVGPADSILNTGLAPFLEEPIYFSYSPSSVGTIYFDNLT
jgi:hypothetical protein